MAFGDATGDWQPPRLFQPEEDPRSIYPQIAQISQIIYSFHSQIL